MPWFKFALLAIIALTLQTASAQNDNKFVEIYSTILNKSCSLGGCHDGSFEPNYTTLMSSYNTLVYHPITKNNRKGEFEYRVVPYDYTNSVLYERITNCCFVDTDDRMPFYDKEGLNEVEIKLIKEWINEGALDIYGNQPKQLPYYPYPESILIYAKSTGGSQTPHIEEFRINNYGEQIGLNLSMNSNYELVIPLDIQQNQALLNLDESLISIISSEPKVLKTFSLVYDSEAQLLRTEINTTDLVMDVPYHFQLSYGKNQMLIFPASSTPLYLKTQWYFYLQ